MVIRSMLGYVLAGLGLVGVAAWSIPQVKTAIPQLNLINDIILISVSGVLAIIGIYLITRGSGGGRQAKEVPIYRGKHVVGFRQMK